MRQRQREETNSVSVSVSISISVSKKNYAPKPSISKASTNGFICAMDIF